jgi:hypothetical protein
VDAASTAGLETGATSLNFWICSKTSKISLLADNFYEDAVGQFAAEQVDYAVFDVAFEDLAGGLGGGLRARCLSCRR